MNEDLCIPDQQYLRGVTDEGILTLQLELGSKVLDSISAVCPIVLTVPGIT